jgi:hypothetical protein
MTISHYEDYALYGLGTPNCRRSGQVRTKSGGVAALCALRSQLWFGEVRVQPRA